MTLHIILPTVGTDGDVHPFLGLGRTLRERGHQVTLATHEHFAPLAADYDLGFLPLVRQADTEAMLDEADFWHPLKGPVVIARWGRQLIRREYALLRDLAVGSNVFFVASPGVVAARLVQEELNLPLVSLVLQPWMIPSIDAPPVMMGGLTLPRWAPRWVGRTYFHLFDRVGNLLIGKELNRLRAEIGGPPIRRLFQWWFSPDLILGMFPDWFGPPQPDWPPHLRLTGFPIRDGCPSMELPEDVKAALAAQSPVVAFTFGTGMKHATRLFEECLEACRQLGVRGVFLTKFRSQLPAVLPPWAIHCEFAPFQSLFPRCAAVVHHGGIGTTAKALAAGVPQLILPFAFDQLDNAQRVKRLGAGNSLGPRRRQAAQIARSLAEILRSRESGAVQTIAHRLAGCDGLTNAADAVEEFGWSQSRRIEVQSR